MADFLVHRRSVAESISNLMSRDPLVGTLSGLFLAAPRRTGKSTFLRKDLVPVLMERGHVVLYVDLWSDRQTDPALLIRNCISAALAEHSGPIARFRASLPVDRIGALGFSVGLKNAQQFEGTVADAMELLSAGTERDIVMIIDEAQQALETTSGLDAMYALKAARDAVNQGRTGRSLYLVMTGSHRDKLAALVYDQKSPFYGGSVRDFPTLGLDFSSALADRVNPNLADGRQIPVDMMDQGFAQLGRKPEMLLDCLREWMVTPADSGLGFLDLVARRKAAAQAALRSELEALTPLQVGLLKLLAEDGVNFAPFSADARNRLAVGGSLPSTGTTQKALEALRSKGFVWRTGHGAYALENAEIAGALTEG